MTGGPIRLDGPRVYVRPPRRGDFQSWHRLREDSREHLVPWEPHWPANANTRGDWRLRSRAWRLGWREGNTAAFFIFSKPDEGLCGGVTLSNIRRGAAQTATLGYWLGASAAGRGYMSEAAGLVCNWAFDSSRLQRIEAGTVLDNERSQRVLETCGFEKEGVAKRYLEIAGERRDHMLYGLTAGVTR